MQTGLVVGDDEITGTLNYLSTGQLVTDWGAGYFMALKFSDFYPDATSCLVGMNPSQGSGLVDILPDPDKNGVFKVTDKDTQVFEFIITDGIDTITKTFDLSGLTLN